MKICSRCNEKKDESEFYKRKDRPGQFQSNCKKCFIAYCAERWKKKKINAIEEMGGCCQECGYNKYYGALEFHHLDPSKKKHSWQELRKHSPEKIKKELEKCILLCANCHREKHMAE